MKESITSFEIINSSNNEMHLIHEPEGFEFILNPNDEVIIEVDSSEETVSLRHSVENGICVIGILPNKSLYSVLHNGVDVFKKYL
jgi:hypothetical protein